MQCRPGCGACCIAPSISSAIPGMPRGKPAGMRCVQLDETNHCRVFGLAERPGVCLAFRATQEFCGNDTAQAMHYLERLEQLTA